MSEPMYCFTMPNQVRRFQILETLLAMRYGQAYDLSLKTAWDLFSPRPRPTQAEVVLDIGRALSSDDSYQSELPPDDEPVDPVAVLQKILGDEYRVSSRMKHRQSEVVSVALPVTGCPKCEGSGWAFEEPRPLVRALEPGEHISYRELTRIPPMIQCDHKRPEPIDLKTHIRHLLPLTAGL